MSENHCEKVGFLGEMKCKENPGDCWEGGNIVTCKGKAKNEWLVDKIRPKPVER